MQMELKVVEQNGGAGGFAHLVANKSFTKVLSEELFRILKNTKASL